MTAWTTQFSAVLFLGPVCSLSYSQAIQRKHSSPSFIALGVGTQNYTCNATSFENVLSGAIAELFDSSCLYGTLCSRRPTTWEASTGLATPQDVITALHPIPDPLVLGQHIYVPRPTESGGTPKWDFTSSGGTASNPNAYAISTKAGDLPSRNPTVNIGDVMLKVIKGDLASQVFRVKNNRGQAPAECNAQRLNIIVKYTTQYCKQLLY